MCYAGLGCLAVFTVQHGAGHTSNSNSATDCSKLLETVVLLSRRSTIVGACSLWQQYTTPRVLAKYDIVQLPENYHQLDGFLPRLKNRKDTSWLDSLQSSKKRRRVPAHQKTQRQHHSKAKPIKHKIGRSYCCTIVGMNEKASSTKQPKPQHTATTDRS